MATAVDIASLLDAEEETLHQADIAFRVVKHSVAAKKALAAWFETHVGGVDNGSLDTRDARWTVFLTPAQRDELASLDYCIISSDTRTKSILGNTQSSWTHTSLSVCKKGSSFGGDEYQRAVITRLQGGPPTDDLKRGITRDQFIRVAYENEEADARQGHSCRNLRVKVDGKEKQVVDVWTSQNEWTVNREVLGELVTTLKLEHVLPFQLLSYLLVLCEARQQWDDSGWASLQGGHQDYGARRALEFYPGNYLYVDSQRGTDAWFTKSDQVQLQFS